MAEVLRFRRLRHAAPRRLRARAGVDAGTRRPDWLAGIGLAAFAFVASAVGFAMLFGSAAVGVPRADSETARFALCTTSHGPNCVIDGDTFRYRGATIRIADIDTPEVFDFGCVSEKARGDAATLRLLSLLNAGPFSLETIGRARDRYGRDLRVVMRDGNSLGAVLVAEGHARTWDGARRSWC